MFKEREVELLIPKWQLSLLLILSAILVLSGIIFENALADLVPWFLISGFVLFLPAFIIIYIDIASRRITHLWSMAMLLVPIIIPFVYLFVRDKLKPVQPELV